MPSFDEHIQAGILAMEERRLDDAITEFNTANALESGRPDVNNLIGIAHLARGQAADAIAPLSLAIRLAEPYTAPDVQPTKREFHLNLAHALQSLDRVQEARTVLEQAVATWPDAHEPRMRLGQLLLGSCQLPDGKAVYRGLANLPDLDEETQTIATALIDCIETFEQSDNDGSLFLQAHRDSYVEYFNQVSASQVEAGWYTEAARMARGENGEPRPIMAKGARPYAMTRVDLVDPNTGHVADVYSDNDPMIVHLNGFEPLAASDVLFPWPDWPFDVWVGSRAPWHWLQLVVEFCEPGAPTDRIDPVIGEWYLSGFNGDFGSDDAGRFHYVTDPEPVGEHAVGYTVDLGRAKFEAVPALLRKLEILHASHAIRRIIIGCGRLPI